MADVNESNSNSGSEQSVCSIETTEELKSDASSSNFGDAACGEPLQAQHLTIDFTPIDDVDNDLMMKKCCAFWEFIGSHPEIKHLMRLPEANIFTQISSSSETETVVNKPVGIGVEKIIPPSPTAVSMLEFVEKKGLIDRAFEAKMPQLHCELGSRVYEDEVKTTKTTQSSKDKTICTCIGECKMCKMQKTEPLLPSSPDREIRVLCENMWKWDIDHPKSMEPPGHAPSIRD